MSKSFPLWSTMLKRADLDQLPKLHPVRVTAQALKDLGEGVELPPAQTIVAKWAAARRTWCAYTGEPLL